MLDPLATGPRLYKYGNHLTLDLAEVSASGRGRHDSSRLTFSGPWLPDPRLEDLVRRPPFHIPPGCGSRQPLTDWVRDPVRSPLRRTKQSGSRREAGADAQAHPAHGRAKPPCASSARAGGTWA